MRDLHLDYETCSDVDLKMCGVDVYSRHASTKVLMLAWRFGDEKFVRVWEPDLSPMPEALADAFGSSAVRKIAFNAAFEIAITQNVLRVPVRIQEWRCVMVVSLSLGLPGDLKTLVRDALALDEKYWKDARGDRLIAKFCSPKRKADRDTHPKEWADFVEYNRQDVIAETKAYKVLTGYVDDMEALFSDWRLDQKINSTGLPIDNNFISAAKKISARAKVPYKEELKALTLLENPNSGQQLLPWLQSRGYPFASLEKSKAAQALEDDRVSEEAKNVVRLRFDSNKTSTAKFDAIERAAFCGRLRGMFQFMGAAATGRWAGRVLGQNMPRPWKVVEPFLGEARRLIIEDDLESINSFFGKPLDVLTSSIRSSISAPPGKKLVVADLAAIELMVIAWLTDCKFWLNVVERGRDPYKAFASIWLGVSYENVTKEMRNLAKPPTLGSGYRLGAGRQFVNKDGDVEKTGLLGYSSKLGVALTKDQCKAATKAYREISTEIVQSWYALERAAMVAVAEKTSVEVLDGRICFGYRRPFLTMALPSGRKIHYCRPRVEPVVIEYEDERTGEVVKAEKIGVTYERVSQTSRKWVRYGNHGGRFIEQAVQGIARDVLLEGLRNADAAGFEVVGHYHDEILALTDEDGPLGLPDLVECMTRLPKWAKGMTCRAEGYEDSFYHKG